MPSCDFCEVDGITRTCSYCGLRYCPEHALPENHKCLDIFRSESHGPDFRHHEQNLLATRSGGRCRGCGKAIKSERKWCFQCATEAPSADESRDSALRVERGGANSCIECGRATSTSHDKCFLCRRSSQDSTQEDQGDKADGDPSTTEFFSAIVDVVASNRLTETLRAKFHAQSWFDFFKRLWATGFLLFVIGVSSFLVAIFGLQANITPFNLFNAVIIVGIAVLAWVVLVTVEAVNKAIDLSLGTTELLPEWELVKVLAGATIVVLLLYETVVTRTRPIEGLLYNLLAITLSGMWLIGGGWLLGGVSGLIRYYTSEE